MKVHTVTGHEVEIDEAEARRIAEVFNGRVSGAGEYAAKTQALMNTALKELREATGYRPKDLNELFEFAVEQDLFGDREETHIYVNFFKVMYALLQKETH